MKKLLIFLLLLTHFTAVHTYACDRGKALTGQALRPLLAFDLIGSIYLKGNGASKAIGGETRSRISGFIANANANGANHIPGLKF